MSKQVESWKSVVGYEGMYEVSNMGRVRSIVVGGTGWKKPFSILKQARDGGGYHRVFLHKVGKKRANRVHRLVLTAFVGECPPNYETSHLDGNSGNNRVDNLEWATVRKNQAMRKKHGTYIEGEKSYSAILTTQKVLHIRKKCRRGSGLYSPRYFADKYGVKTGTIYAVINRVTWKHI